MIYHVVITERAAQEIEDAAAWWAREHSVEQALHWYQDIREAIADLASSPERFPIAPEQTSFRYEIRELHYGRARRRTHRVVFRILGDHVIVLTVRHGARDRLKPEDLAS